MFHSARALLFLNGFGEKSHFAVARFLEDFYVIPNEDEAKNALKSAKEFVDRMKKLARLENLYFFE